MANYYRIGKGGVTNDRAMMSELATRATALFEKECAAGDLTSCNQAASFLSDGVELMGVEPDLAKAAGYAQKACDGGRELACEEATRLKAQAGGR